MPEVIKHTLPNKLTVLPFGTTWVVQGNEKTNLTYVQVSRDEENPHWITMGDFLEIAFASELKNQDFLQKCLKKF